MTATGMAAALDVHQLEFGWSPALPLLRIPRLQIRQGERVLLFGPSGSGKSTLLSLLSGVQRASSGQVAVLGTDLGGLSGPARDHFRAEHIGFVFQLFNLLPYLNLLDNVLLPCRFSAPRAARAVAAHGSLTAHARALLEALKLDRALEQRPVTQLSVGQQQRVAVARALAGAPQLLICDEPTSALDSDARTVFLEVLFTQCKQANSTLLLVSHDRSLAPLFSRSLDLAGLNSTVPAT